MKIYKLLLLGFLLCIHLSCSAQLVKTLDDVGKIKPHEKEFISKPLETFLKEVRPQIKLFFTHPGTPEQRGYITLLFVNYDQYKKLVKDKKKKVRIIVFLKEPFDPNDEQLPIEKRFIWTKYDKQLYGDLTVTGIEVFGEN